MKIQDFAEMQKMSNNALYKAIRREGYSAKDLTDKRGNITSSGLKILHRMYPEEIEEQAEQKKKEEPQTEQLNLEKELDNLKKQYAEEKERSEKWERLYLELQDSSASERLELQQQIKAAQILLAQQQEINSRLLTNPIKRLFSGFKKGR